MDENKNIEESNEEQLNEVATDETIPEAEQQPVTSNL